MPSGVPDWESSRIGAGAPPIELDDGWLVVYHGCGATEGLEGVGAYCAGTVLLDRHDPTRVLRRSADPIMQPTEDFEREGFLRSVVFPTALVNCGPKVTTYYGAADTAAGSAEFSRAELIASMH